MEGFIVAAGVATRYSDVGSGNTAIVLIHGYLNSIEIWEDFAKGLSKEFRVLSVDLPGHGISEVMGEVHTMDMLSDVVHDAMLSRGIERAVIIGHSMGGYVALSLAERHSEAVSGLILFHSTPNDDIPERKERREREMEIISSGRKELLSRTSPGTAFASINRKRFADFIEGLALQVMITEDEGIMAMLRGMAARTDKNDTLRNLKAPKMFIFGRHDEYISVEAAEAIAAAHPEVRTEWLENSGHIGFIEEPELSTEIVSTFCKTL